MDYSVNGQYDPFLPKSHQRVLTKGETILSAHRLARSAKPYNPSRPAKIETAEEYARNYFAANPDIEVDKRDPLEKLDNIKSLLNNKDLQPQDKFNLLTQRKSLSLIAFGENTIELFESLKDLGIFYNDQHRPESAMRHFRRAYQMLPEINVNEKSEMSLCIEFAMAHLESEAANKAEADKHVSAAEKLASPYKEISIEDDNLQYKRSLVFARIYGQCGNTEESINFYNDAITAYEKVIDGEHDVTLADLYAELGIMYEANDNHDNAKDAYKKAYKYYNELDLPDRAAEFEKYIHEDTTEEKIQDSNSF